MDITRAFSYIFEDRDWAGKLAIIALLTLIAPFVPFGLAALAALLGYLVELARNVRDGAPTPLPHWDTFNDKLASGANVLLAWFVYNIPNFLISGCIFTFSGAFDSLLGSGVALMMLCCVVPFLLVYNLVTWPMLAVGLARYAETGQGAEFYRFGELLAALRAHSGEALLWIILTLLVNIAFGFLAAIPCLGWAAVLALAFPVHGHLLGQFARLIGEKPKRKFH